MLAIEKAASLGWKKLWIETDCRLVVKAFSNFAIVPWTIRSRWLCCHGFTQSIEFMILHVYMEANFYVDYPANIGCFTRFYFYLSLFLSF